MQKSFKKLNQYIFLNGCHLFCRVEDKLGALRERDQTIAAMEAEIAEVKLEGNFFQQMINKYRSSPS